MSRLYRWLGVDTPFDVQYRFETSWLLSPRLLLLLRLLIATYCLAVSILVLVWPGVQPQRTLTYFTVLSFWGLTAYFLVAALHTGSLVLTGKPLLNRWPRPLQALHSLFYSTIVVYPFLVTIVFWIVLYHGHGFPTTFRTWSNVSQHALNAVFALLEIILTRTALPPWLHLLPLLIILVLYLALANLTYATQQFFPYSFLDPKDHGRARVAVYVAGIFAVILMVFLFVRLLIWIRLRLSEGPSSVRKASTDSAQTLARSSADDLEAYLETTAPAPAPATRTRRSMEMTDVTHILH
ncbi:MAG: RNA-binding component of cleavage and polyadenylation factor [Watsoniomyces obsoletus]|nr:MAG: RNA-binding component of cleavage and polyadenylation factor [Watsoniomyces obsoletus]